MRITSCMVALLALLFASPSLASESGQATFAITEYSCPEAPSTKANCPDHPEAAVAGDTGRIAGSVRVVMDDGFVFSTSYGNTNKIGVSLVMTGAPACKRLQPVSGGSRMYENHLASAGFPAWLDGMTFGNDISAGLAQH